MKNSHIEVVNAVKAALVAKEWELALDLVRNSRRGLKVLFEAGLRLDGLWPYRDWNGRFVKLGEGARFDSDTVSDMFDELTGIFEAQHRFISDDWYKPEWCLAECEDCGFVSKPNTYKAIRSICEKHNKRTGHSCIQFNPDW